MFELYYIFNESISDFFKRIDENGGWPVQYHYVSIRYSSDDKRRYCYFSNEKVLGNTICSSDAYYWWKITDRGKHKVIKTIIDNYNEVIKKEINIENYDLDRYVQGRIDY